MTLPGRGRPHEPVRPGAGRSAGPGAHGDAAAPRPGGAGQQTVRRHNLALVLHEVAAGEPVSRAGVAARTGLTRGTVSSLVEELLADGLLTELAATRGGTGRPANPLQLNRSGPAGLGLEIGVDHVGACVVDLTGAVRARRTRRRPTGTGRRRSGWTRWPSWPPRWSPRPGWPICGAGVALPGVIGADGRLQRAPNLPRWVDLSGGTPSCPAPGRGAGAPRERGRPGRAGRAVVRRRPGGDGRRGRPARLPVRVRRDRGRRRDRAGRARCSAGPAGGPASWGTWSSTRTARRAAAAGAAAWSRPPGSRRCCGAAGAGTVDGAARTAPGGAIETAGRALGIALTGAVHLLDVRDRRARRAVRASSGSRCGPRSRPSWPARVGPVRGAAGHRRAPGARCAPPRPGWSGTAAAASAA